MKLATFSSIVKSLRVVLALAVGLTVVGCDLFTVENSVGDSSSGSVYADCEVTDPAGEVSLSVGATDFNSLNSIDVDVNAPTTRFSRSYSGNGQSNWFEQYDIRGRAGDRVKVDFSIEDNVTGSFRDTDTTVCR